MSIGIEFQRRYATIVLELEQLNKDLNKVLHKVQQYCYEVSALYGFFVCLVVLVWVLVLVWFGFFKNRVSVYSYG